MTVRAVLDTSAVLAYASVDQALPVAELIQLVGEENLAIGDDPDDVDSFTRISQVGIPASTFLAAYTQTDSFGRNLLADLVADLAVAEQLDDNERSTFVFLPLARVGDILGASELDRSWPGQGEAIHHAMQHNAILATFRPPKKPVPGISVADLSASWDD